MEIEFWGFKDFNSLVELATCIAAFFSLGFSWKELALKKQKMEEERRGIDFTIMDYKVEKYNKSTICRLLLQITNLSGIATAIPKACLKINCKKGFSCQIPFQPKPFFQSHCFEILDIPLNLDARCVVNGWLIFVIPVNLYTLENMQSCCLIFEDLNHKKVIRELNVNMFDF